MKVVTVRQPFASLIAVGAKTLLDQARPTGYRGRLLIRAAQKSVDWTLPTATFDPFPHDEEHPWDLAAPLPRGVVVASCELVDCVPIAQWETRSRVGTPTRHVFTHRDGTLTGWRFDDDARTIGCALTSERPLGDFSPGRWAWILDDVRPTTERCPRCWGTGTFMTEWADGEPAEAWCSTCDGALVCPPVRMTGGTGLRTPEWEPR